MKVQFFSSQYLHQLESRINAWLENHRGQFQSIQYSTTTVTPDNEPLYTAMVVYKEKPHGEF